MNIATVNKPDRKVIKIRDFAIVLQLMVVD